MFNVIDESTYNNKKKKLPHTHGTVLFQIRCQNNEMKGMKLVTESDSD
jgi:hypothetical protein